MEKAERNRFEFRLTPEQRVLFEQAAERDARPLASWIRTRLERMAQEELANGRKGGRPRSKP